MACPLRLEFSGAVYHLTVAGQTKGSGVIVLGPSLNPINELHSTKPFQPLNC